MSIPFKANKTYGIKGMIWKTASGVHQETWYDDGSGWKKAGVYDRPSCGKKQTSTAPASGAQVEFRNDCNNVTYSGTDIAVINPPRGFANVEAVPTNTSQTEDDDCNPCDPGDCAYDPKYCNQQGYYYAGPEGYF